jgi:hypothetical protein
MSQHHTCLFRQPADTVLAVAPVAEWPDRSVGLAVSMQHPIEAAHRADIKALVVLDRPDLSRRQRCNFRLVAVEQDPLVSLLAEAKCQVSVAAFAAIDANTVTIKLPLPALQSRQPHA